MVSPTRLNVIFAVSAVAAFSIISFPLLHSATRNKICALPELLSHSEPVQHSTTIQHHDNRKVHLLLPINANAAEQSLDFCKTLLSVLVHGYEPVLLNWNIDGGDVGFMQRAKITGVHDYLANITDKSADNDLVIMIDALDVWLQISPQTLTKRFDELGTSGVVVSAENNCWPNAAESFACQGVPNSTLPKGTYAPKDEPRWANSGTVMGSVAGMRELYIKLVAAFEEQQWWTDQGIFNEFLAARHISLDYRSRLFWTANYVAHFAHFIRSPYHIDNLIPHKLYPSLLYISPTGEVPAVIHFNGAAKPLMDEWWGKLWWQKQQDVENRFGDIVASRMRGAVVRVAGGGLKEWSKLCPKDLIEI